VRSKNNTIRAKRSPIKTKKPNLENSDKDKIEIKIRKEGVIGNDFIYI
jgi:hypothetical protein